RMRSMASRARCSAASVTPASPPLHHLRYRGPYRRNGGRMPEMDFILYEVVERVAVITLNRPDRRNAQNPQLLRELDRAWEMAAEEKEVRVIVVKANVPHFSAGHDISASRDRAIVSEIDIANDGL